MRLFCKTSHCVELESMQKNKSGIPSERSDSQYFPFSESYNEVAGRIVSSYLAPFKFHNQPPSLQCPIERSNRYAASFKFLSKFIDPY
jgi:hypothetical protein